MNRRSQRPHRNLRKALRIESLEDRQLMAGITTNFDRITRTLTIAGSDAADVVSITQNDSANRLTVTTRTANETATDQQFPAHLVNRIVVQLGDGDDQFQYQTVRSVLKNKTIEVHLGTGNDTAKIGWADNGGTSFANLDLMINGDDGSDAVGARIGRLSANVAAELNIELGEGDDGFVAQTLNPMASRSQLRINAFGDGGDDELQYFASGKIGWGARVDVLMNGNTGDDSIEFSNQGQIDGALSELLLGGDGNDLFSSSVIDGSGRGSLSSSLRGDTGDDVIISDIRSNAAPSYSVRELVNGGAGEDTAFTPGHTIVNGVENALPINRQVAASPNEPFDPILRTSTLRLDSRTIEYWTKGRSTDNFAPVVVLLTGAGGSIDSWLPIADKLNGVGQVIAVNKPGFGRTSAIASASPDYALAVIEDVRSVVSKLAPGRQVILVGHSLGGAYANLFARLHPDEVAGVVFEDATQQQRVDRAEIAAEFMTPVFRVYPAGIQAELDSIADTINAPLDAPDFPAIPVIALSQALPDEQLALAQALADLGSPGSLQVIEDAGHFLHADKPQAVIDAIDAMVRKTEVSGILADVIAKYGVPGMTASVNIGDKVISGAAGVRAAGAQVAVNVNDRFGMGSVTKAMTATLAGVLIEKGILRWDSTIVELFPELRDTMQTGYQDVTLEQLLQHRGGMIADEDGSEALGQKIAEYAGPTNLSRLTLLPEILKEPMPGRVGEFRYSNAGYAVAGAMLERASHRSYETLMQRYIFNPLGMKSATVNPPVSDPLHPKQPIGHLPDGTPAPGDRSPFDYLSALASPAGSILRMNAGDWSKFVRVHLGESVNGRRLLQPGTLARLHQSVELEDAGAPVGYAAGWVVLPAESAGLDSSFGTVLTHNGSDGVWLSEVVALPDVDFSIQILANATVDREGNDLGQGAFLEIKQRLLHRFARNSNLPQVANGICDAFNQVSLRT